MNQVGVGVIGVGLMGSLFARLASQLPDSKLVFEILVHYTYRSVRVYI